MNSNMNPKSCDLTAELLVPYADGELSAADARRVADHLADCPDCRAELGLLGRSLELAREVWQESAARAPVLETTPIRPKRRWIAAAACVAACAVVLLLTAGPWLFSRWESHRQVNTPDEVEQPVRPELVEKIDVETLIAREVRSARLAAAAELLASQPGLEQYAREAERYLAEAYRGTAAANGTIPPPPSPPIKEPKS